MTPSLLLLGFLAGQASGHDGPVGAAMPSNYRPAELNGAGVEQHLGRPVPLDVPFRGHDGNVVTLGDFGGARPMILVLAYFKCPMLCTEVLNGLFESLPRCGLSPDQYEVVVVSFDASEGPELAAAKRKHYLEQFGRPGLDQRVHFLTGDPTSIDRLTSAVGFSYGFDPKSQQFAHPGMITLLTPDGKIARYFFGIRFQPRDLRLGLVEASAGKIGTFVDSVILYCLYYDPNGATYAAAIMRIVRAAGVFTVVAMGGLLWRARHRERRRTRSA